MWFCSLGVVHRAFNRALPYSMGFCPIWGVWVLRCVAQSHVTMGISPLLARRIQALKGRNISARGTRGTAQHKPWKGEIFYNETLSILLLRHPPTPFGQRTNPPARGNSQHEYATAILQCSIFDSSLLLYSFVNAHHRIQTKKSYRKDSFF
jgi:hypothetical protein